MNREIKFRAWCEPLKKMFNPSEVNVIFDGKNCSIGLSVDSLDKILQKIDCHYDGEFIYKNIPEGLTPEQQEEFEEDNDALIEVLDCDNDWIMVEGMLPVEFTGLKDKNEVEIYEGDIVNFRANFCPQGYNGYKTGIVEWEYDRFIIRANDYKYSILDETDEFDCKSEIIGNVFENPELLEVNND